ncbi:hypothetical protein HMPREF1394_00193 [Helicobacter pylori GAM105Ai]|nr:hypothetical protein HMPREF1394_00193 [Helicobacter pylori GAM105Ai]
MLKECLNCKKFDFNLLIGRFILVLKELVQGGEPIKEQRSVGNNKSFTKPP